MIVGHSGSYRGTVGRAGPGIANNSNLDARLFRERDPIVATDGASRGAAEAEAGCVWAQHPHRRLVLVND